MAWLWRRISFWYCTTYIWPECERAVGNKGISPCFYQPHSHCLSHWIVRNEMTFVENINDWSLTLLFWLDFLPLVQSVDITPHVLAYMLVEPSKLLHCDKFLPSLTEHSCLCNKTQWKFLFIFEAFIQILHTTFQSTINGKLSQQRVSNCHKKTGLC